jgi:excisionase family DNA binding protein
MRSTKKVPRRQVIPAVTIPSNTELLTLAQVSHTLQVSCACLRAWVRLKKNLPVVRVGDCIRFRKSDVDAYISAHTTAVQS